MGRDEFHRAREHGRLAIGRTWSAIRSCPRASGRVQRWFNTAAFEAQPQFTLGNAPPTVGWGPSQRRLDLSLFKDINLRGNTRLQLRYEVYNVTNTANFANPNTALGNAAVRQHLEHERRHPAADAVRREGAVLNVRHGRRARTCSGRGRPLRGLRLVACPGGATGEEPGRQPPRPGWA